MKKPDGVDLAFALGGAVKRLQRNTLQSPEFVNWVKGSFGESGYALVRLTLDPSLKIWHVVYPTIGSQLITTHYGDEEGIHLIVHNHGADLKKPVLVNLQLPEEGEKALIVATIRPVDSTHGRFDGHIWFGDIKNSYAGGSTGAVSIASRKITTDVNRRAFVEKGWLTSLLHFVEGFTFVFAGSLGSVDPTFFRFTSFGGGSLENLFPVTSITPLGVEDQADGNFYPFGTVYKPSEELKVNEYQETALAIAFYHGVGAFNLVHLENVAIECKLDKPKTTAKLAWEKLYQLAGEGHFEIVETVGGVFLVPSPKFYV